MRRRILSVILMICLCVPLFPTASAAESTPGITKTGRTLYTDEMVAAARENIAKYSWAKSQKDSAVAAADKFVALGAEYIWNNITSQGIPRAYAVAFENGHPIRDPYEFYCRYCNSDLLEKHGNYPWTVNAITTPWKIKCPECERLFPSNDFGKFYELGRTKENQGKFDRVTALEAHRALLIEKGLLSQEAINMASPGKDLSSTWYTYYGYGVPGGYLHNDLYPEVGTPAAPDVKFTPESGETTGRWAVDDGLGYNTGRVYDNGLGENHSYIPYYNHFGVWYFSGNAIAASALDKLGLAYLYTGDEKYGRLGAIILDRVADIYPDLSLNPWRYYPNSTGGSSIAGKDLGRIWASYSAECYAEAYDIFFPMYEDAEVIAFLSEKAAYYGMENDKTTAAKIRKNVADGTVREIFKACKTAQIFANFGIHQQTMIKAAIALDEPTETAAMIDWVFAASKSDAQSYNTGGDISQNLVDTVYRDGQNAESPVYNQYAITDLMDSAVALDRYADAGNDIGQHSLLSHPKYVKMINSFMPLVLVRRALKGTGDTGDPAQYSYLPSLESLISAFNAIRNNPEAIEETIKVAQQLYLRGVNNHHYDIFTPNAGSLKTDVVAIIDKYGNYDWDKSTIMTGYGYAILRAGTVKSVSIDGPRDTQRDFMLNFSGHPKHNHADMLDLGLEAYGIPFTSDFGYAEFMVTGDPHSNQLTSATIGHNTVVVNEKNSSTPSAGTPQYPLHFDAKDTRVKVIDASTPDAYPNDCDEYRRTIVMVDASDEISYGVDFFRVTGGDDHLYTFMPNSITRPESNLSFVKQIDQPLDTWKDEKNYYMTSSYAGPTVQFGRDPLKTPTSSYRDLMYPRGYTWFYDVEKCLGEIGEFYVDYKIEDFRGYSRNGNINPRLRITMLNDFKVNEVSLVSTIPQRIKANDCIDHFEKVFVRRKGTGLDSLFTAVYEPYRGNTRYIEAISSVKIAPSSGEELATDEAKAVKVELTNGRIDYIVYATNKNVTYKVTDGETGYSFDFSGFVGVWTIDAETDDNTYSYINDGSMLGTGSNKIRSREAALTGTVTDFQKTLSFDNWADVTFDSEITEKDAADLVDRMIIFERSVAGTGAYLIEGVEKTGNNTARISFGTTSTIDGFVDAFDESKGYKYIIEEGKSFSIPMSYEREPYDGKLSYVFSHDAHESTKGNKGTAYSDVTKLGFDDIDTTVSTGAWGNLGNRASGSMYASGMSSALSVHRSGDFINLAFDYAKYNTADGFYNYYSKLNESSASGPIAMIAIDVPKSGRYVPSLSAGALNSAGQVFEVYLIKETDENKRLTAAQIRNNLSLSDRIGAYDSSVGGLKEFAEHDLTSGLHYLAFVPVERGEKTGSENRAQVYLQPTAFHLDPVAVVEIDSYNPDALGGDGKLFYDFGIRAFNTANKVYEDGAEEPTWYFGNTAKNIKDYYTAIGKTAPDYSSPLNTSTDTSAEAKARDKYLTWKAGDDFTDADRGNTIWFRPNISLYLHFTYGGICERTYDYLNLNRTDKWQYVAYTGDLDRAQLFSWGSSLHNQIKAGCLEDIGKGNECTILKINIPSSGEYDFSISLGNGAGTPGFAAYLLPATKPLPLTYEERLPYQISLDEWTSSAKTGKYTAYTAGDYYFIVESFRGANTTTPSAGRWDVDLKSLTLTATGPATLNKSQATIDKEKEKAFTPENPAASLVADTSAVVTILARETSDEDTDDKKLEQIIGKTTVEKAGDVCTVTAPEIEGYTFRYWGVGLGRNMKPVSTDAEYSFKAPKGNTFLSAFYSNDRASDVIVEFYNANGDVVSRKLYDRGEKIEIPDLVSLTGVGNSIGWAGYLDGDEENIKIFGTDREILASGNIMAYTAAYDEEEIAATKEIQITAEGSTGITGAGSYAFGDVVTLTAPYRHNDGGFGIFVCWKKNGEIVSVDRSYTFNAAVDATVTAVYSSFLPTTEEKLRKILVSSIGDNATVAEFIGCDGALERGFIFDGNGIEDATFKYAMKTDATSFTMTYDTGLHPKAYAIFSDGVIYSR